MRPATSSQRYWRAAWRYWRMRTMRPSSRTGMTTTEPEWEITSRVALTPEGSITSSRFTEKTGPLYTTLLLRTLALAAVDFFADCLDVFFADDRFAFFPAMEPRSVSSALFNLPIQSRN